MQSLNYLVVEDHAFQRALLEQLLRGLGAQTVHSTANGAEAARVLRDPAVRIDVVISDLMMPDVDGIELLPALRKSSPVPALILVSAEPKMLAAAEAIAQAHGIVVLGALAKPLTPKQLQHLLQRHMANLNRPAQHG